MRPFLPLAAALGACSLLLPAACGGDSNLFDPAAAGSGGGDASTAGHGGSTPEAGAGSGGAAGWAGTGASAGQGGASGGASGTGGAAGAAGCPSGCDDGVACTVDTCAQGACVHTPGTCPTGEFCDVKVGCTKAPICSADAQCTALWGADPCKTNVHCDGASATCKFAPLDKDNDQHAPVVCGGGDCDDTDPQRHPGLAESCDGKDNNCNVAVDDGASCPGAQTCQAGVCACPPANVCDSECVDKSSNPAHCGACFNVCPLTATCVSGGCKCPGTQTQCGAACVDTSNNLQHCGSCNTACGPYESCSAGACKCTKTLCGGICKDTQTDPSNCGTCGVSCAQGATCQAGTCVCPGSQPTACGGKCVDTSTDAANCGTCGNVCGLGACKAGVCQTCLPGGMMVLIDRSGSMSGTKFTSTIDAVGAFVQEPASSGLSVGVNFYPRLSGSTTLCATSDYAVPDVAISTLPGATQTILFALSGKSPNTASVFSPPLEAALKNVRDWRLANPNRLGAVVMINDGGIGIGCSSDSLTWASSAASSAYGGTPSVPTHIIGLGTPSTNEVQQWTTIAAAGGGTLYHLPSVSTQAVLGALQTARAALMCP